MGAQVVQHRVDPLDVGVEPALDLLQEVDPVGGGAAGVGRGQRLAGRRAEGAEDVAVAAPPVVDLLGGAPCRASARSAPRRADGPAPGWRARTAPAAAPGSSWRSPVPSRRGRSRHCPPAGRCRAARWPPFFGEGGIGPLAEPGLLLAPAQALGLQDLADAAALDGDALLLVRYAASRSSVQLPKGRPSSSGSVRLAAMTSPTSSGVYVGGRPGRGGSCSPASPAR